MYKIDEKLVLLSDYGRKELNNFLPKGSIIFFKKSIDVGMKSFVLVTTIEGKQLTLPELAVRSTETDPLSVLNTINKSLISKNPNLGIYHPNLFIRLLYKIRLFFKGLLTRNKNVSKLYKDYAETTELKSIINKESDSMEVDFE